MALTIIINTYHEMKRFRDAPLFDHQLSASYCLVDLLSYSLDPLKAIIYISSIYLTE